MKKHFEEVEEKLMEETRYELELKRGQEIAEACSHIQGVHFPKYYSEWSSNKVLVMDYLEGDHLKEFLDKQPSQEVKNKIAQALWDFYEFQLHEMKAIHADPHPGNFLFNDEASVGVIDFGCIKEVPMDFYYQYFPLLIPEVQGNPELIDRLLTEIEIIFPQDDDKVKEELTTAFIKMTALLSRPFNHKEFHFTQEFIDEIYATGEEIYKIPEVKKPTQPRGSKHALYINRTYFGIYSMLADLNATIKTEAGDWKNRLLDKCGM
jgi:predicted unusual protein kinase regulating ubiquinone biosynthesis (AarF/ABC1/UbiB family)